MARAISFYPDESPVKLVLSDGSFEETYTYKRIEGIVDGEKQNGILVPLDEKSGNPPSAVIEYFEDYDIQVVPSSIVDKEFRRIS